MAKGEKVRYNGGTITTAEMGKISIPTRLEKGKIYTVADTMNLVERNIPVCHLEGEQGIFKQEWFTRVA